MDSKPTPSTDAAAPDEPAWPNDIFAALKAADVRQVAYVPDAGHAALIRMALADPAMTATVLTTEEEGIGLACGAWLGGQRAVLLMQSSGVGNCINAFGMVASCRFPLLMLVTMRGEWAEFNPWQVPMGRATPKLLRAMGIEVARVGRAEQAGAVVGAAATKAFEGDRAVAVLLSQRLIGRKQW